MLLCLSALYTCIYVPTSLVVQTEQSDRRVSGQQLFNEMTFALHSWHATLVPGYTTKFKDLWVVTFKQWRSQKLSLIHI